MTSYASTNRRPLWRATSWKSTSESLEQLATSSLRGTNDRQRWVIKTSNGVAASIRILKSCHVCIGWAMGWGDGVGVFCAIGVKIRGVGWCEGRIEGRQEEGRLRQKRERQNCFSCYCNWAIRTHDRRTDRIVDGWTYRKWNRRLNRQNCRRMNLKDMQQTELFMNELIRDATDGWTDRWTEIIIDGRTYKRCNRQMHKKKKLLIDEQTELLTDELIAKRCNRRMNKQKSW